MHRLYGTVETAAALFGNLMSLSVIHIFLEDLIEMKNIFLEHGEMGVMEIRASLKNLWRLSPLNI